MLYINRFTIAKVKDLQNKKYGISFLKKKITNFKVFENMADGKLKSCWYIGGRVIGKPFRENVGSRVSLVAQTVKRLSTMQETWVRSLGREDPLEKEMATHSSILAWKIPWTEEPGSPWGHKELDTTE